MQKIKVIDSKIAVMLSAVLPVFGFVGNMVQLLTRLVFPVSIAVIVSGLGGQPAADVAGASFPVILVMMAIYAGQLARL